MSDDFLMEDRLKLLGGWRSAGMMEGVRNVLKVSELNYSAKETAYQERGGEVESVEKEWKSSEIW